MTKFEQYSSVFKVYASNGHKSLLFKGVGKHINLDKTRVWGVGIDQSTQHSGIAFKTLDNNGKAPLIFLMDVVNVGLPNKEIYSLMLQDLLRLIFEGQKISLLIFEQPIPNAAFMATRTKLQELKGFMNTMRYTIPELENTTVLSVPPSGWRKHYLADPRYKGMRTQTDDLKFAVMQEGLLRYPIFKSYSEVSNKPMDSFDALGILEDGPREFFFQGNLSIRRYNKNMYPSVKNIAMEYDVISYFEEDVQSYVRDRAAEIADDYDIEDFDEFAENRGISVYVVDEVTEDINSQVSAIVSNTNAICLIVFKYDRISSSITFMWANELKLEQNEAYCCIAWRTITNKKGDPDFQPYSFIEMDELFEEEIQRAEQAELED